VVYLDSPNEVIRVAPAEEEDITNGLADFLAQEEMDRYRGFWWSPDSTQLLFTSVDDRNVANYTITRQGKDVVEEERYRYPFVGGPNPVVELGVVALPPRQGPIDGNPSPVKWLRICEDDMDRYIARAGWWPDGSVMVQVQSRDQTTLDVKRIDLRQEGGEATALIRETASSWINLHDMLTPLSQTWRPPSAAGDGSGAHADDFYFIWASERSGFCHLYLYRFDANSNTAVCVRTLTSGEWVVDSVDAVDEVRCD
jgi:dipeptidyl-peptidase-4